MRVDEFYGVGAVKTLRTNIENTAERYYNAITGHTVGDKIYRGVEEYTFMEADDGAIDPFLGEARIKDRILHICDVEDRTFAELDGLVTEKDFQIDKDNIYFEQFSFHAAEEEENHKRKYDLVYTRGMRILQNGSWVLKHTEYQDLQIKIGHEETLAVFIIKDGELLKRGVRPVVTYPSGFINTHKPFDDKTYSIVKHDTKIWYNFAYDDFNIHPKGLMVAGVKGSHITIKINDIIELDEELDQNSPSTFTIAGISAGYRMDVDIEIEAGDTTPAELGTIRGIKDSSEIGVTRYDLSISHIDHGKYRELLNGVVDYKEGAFTKTINIKVDNAVGDLVSILGVLERVKRNLVGVDITDSDERLPLYMFGRIMNDNIETRELNADLDDVFNISLTVIEAS